MNWFLVASTLALAGCSSGGATGVDGAAASDAAVVPDLAAAATTEVQGTVGGESFGAASALSTTEDDGFGGTTLLVDLTDSAGVCARAMSNAGFPDGHVIAMSLYGATTGPPTGPATLTVSASFTPRANSAFVHWSKNANQCNVAQDAGTSGTVTITSVGAEGVAGTFDIRFSGGHVTGSFVAPPCAALATWNPPHGPGC